MDMTASIAPRSDQQNADDFMSGPRTFSIESVTAGTAEQPIDINLVEAPGRPYKPSKSMRRVLVTAWGAEASEYTGRRLTLFRDPAIKFGGIAVGGIAISHLSHLDSRLTLALTVTRGKRAPFTVEPLIESAPPKQAANVSTTDLTESQSTGIGKHIKRLGLGKDAYLELATTAAGRIVGGTAELTESEAALVIAALASVETPTVHTSDAQTAIQAVKDAQADNG